MSRVEPKVIVALDFADPAAARKLVARLPVGGCRIKVGKELFLRGGPDLVAGWVRAGWDVFLDLKFHDIPNTVAAACRAAVDLGVWMVNVHALGGPEMLRAARAAVPRTADAPHLIAVTVLTSHDEASLAAIGLDGSPARTAIRLARLAWEAGADGVVCSAREAEGMRAALGEDFRLVTPGIRPAGAAADDQRRIMTPRDALAAGADDLVIGRPITRAEDPAAALAAINADIGGA
jgi:orotidine-5'-phosphate decarboxylase